MKHPYQKFENTKLWQIVEKAVLDLEENQDLKLTELKKYVVGYICNQLTEEGLVK